MTSLTLPDDIGDGEMIVQFVVSECRNCSERSPWYRSDDDKDDASYEWIFEHALTGPEHCKFYRYSVARNTATVG